MKRLTRPPLDTSSIETWNAFRKSLLRRVSLKVEIHVERNVRWGVEDLVLNTIVVSRVASVGTSIWGLNG